MAIGRPPVPPLNSNLARFNTISGIVLIGTANVTSDAYGQIVVPNTLGTIYAGLATCTKHIAGTNYVLTAEAISSTEITVRARKVSDGSALPAGNSVGSLAFIKWG